MWRSLILATLLPGCLFSDHRAGDYCVDDGQCTGGRICAQGICVRPRPMSDAQPGALDAGPGVDRGADRPDAAPPVTQDAGALRPDARPQRLDAQTPPPDAAPQGPDAVPQDAEPPPPDAEPRPPQDAEPPPPPDAAPPPPPLPPRPQTPDCAGDLLRHCLTPDFDGWVDRHDHVFAATDELLVGIDGSGHNLLEAYLRFDLTGYLPAHPLAEARLTLFYRGEARRDDGEWSDAAVARVDPDWDDQADEWRGPRPAVWDEAERRSMRDARDDTRVVFDVTAVVREALADGRIGLRLRPTPPERQYANVRWVFESTLGLEATPHPPLLELRFDP